MWRCQPAGTARRREAARARPRLFGEAGVTLRRSAVGVDDAALVAEREALASRWARLQREANERKRPAGWSATNRRSNGCCAKLSSTGQNASCWPTPRSRPGSRRWPTDGWRRPMIALERLPSDVSAFANTGVDAAIEQALAVDVPLPRRRPAADRGDGGVRCHRCRWRRAGGAGRRPRGSTEIARQLRLRNLGGTVVVDFIDLPTRPQRQRLEEALKRAFRDDPLGVQLYPMSPLGLVQLSRPRRGRTLAALLTRGCPACNGSGRVSSLRAVAEELLGRLRAGACRAAPACIARSGGLSAGRGGARLAGRGRAAADRDRRRPAAGQLRRGVKAWPRPVPRDRRLPDLRQAARPALPAVLLACLPRPRPDELAGRPLRGAVGRGRRGRR